MSRFEIIDKVRFEQHKK